MTLRQRRDQLQAEVSKLLDIVVEYHIDLPSGRVENPFMDELEAQLQRKTEELDELNARVNSPIYRFRETSHDMLLVIWIMAVSLCLITPFFSLVMWDGLTTATFVILSIASLIWAIWSSRLPSV